MRRLIAIFLAPFVLSACGGGSTPTTPTPQGAACTVTVPQAQMNVTATAGPTAIPVTANSTCAYTVISSQPWLTITSGTGATGSSTVTFSVAENTGAQRTAIVTIGTTQVTVTQAAGLPPVVVNGTVPGTIAVGAAVNVQFTAVGGNGGPYTFSLQSGSGFPPIGVTLSTGGLLAGVANAAGNAAFGVCATDSGGRTGCTNVTLSVTAPSGTGAFLGNWSGTIILADGCTTPLPQNYPWTGTFRATANGGTELVVSVPRALVFSEAHTVAITGQRLQFTVDIDGPYVFVADFSADFRSLNGTFVGTNCAIPPTEKIPRGSWNGVKQ
jgi:hypothetical protein